MPETKIPSIEYQMLEGPIQSYLSFNMQYLLMLAGVETRTYDPGEFLSAIDRASLDGIASAQRKRAISDVKSILAMAAKRASSVTIKDFSPNRQELEDIMLMPFRERHSD